MKKVKQKKTTGVKSRKIVFSKKKATLLKDHLLNVIIKQIIN